MLVVTSVRRVSSFGAQTAGLWLFANLPFNRLKTAPAALTISTRWQRVLISGMIRFLVFSILDFREISINVENL